MLGVGLSVLKTYRLIDFILEDQSVTSVYVSPLDTMCEFGNTQTENK